MLVCISIHSSHILMKLKLSGQIFEKSQISNFMKIRRVGAESFHVDGRTDTTKLIVAFRNFGEGA